MKKLVIALTALAAFTGSASAADLAARPYTKAPAPVVMAPNWTGFYIFGGGGGGLWDANGGVDSTASGACIVCTNTKTGGDGWFGTVGAGYDWQTGPSWVFGIFGDGTFGSLKGNIGDSGVFAVPSEIQHLRWLSGGTTLEWDSDSARPGSATRYDVLRGDLSTVSNLGASSGDICLSGDISETQVLDSSPRPAGGLGWFFLVRGHNSCAAGRYESASNGSDRAAVACP